jgi:hypothetical protein
MSNPSNVTPQSADLRWSQETRLRMVDALVFWEGRVNRSDLIRRFGISVPQATNDLRRYLELAPANLRYDTRQKAYLAEDGFAPLFGMPDAEAWLRGAAADGGAMMPVETTPMPPRRIDPIVLRRVLAARRGGLALRVLYQSMDEPEPTWRWLVPVALAGDGVRWHLRTYNEALGRFEDLLFPRMVQIDGERPAGVLPEDLDWNRFVTVELRPASRLSAGQRAVIAVDYGMQDEACRVEVRSALLFVFLQRIGVNGPGALLELANRDAVEAELEGITRRFRIPTQTSNSTPDQR